MLEQSEAAAKQEVSIQTKSCQTITLSDLLNLFFHPPILRFEIWQNSLAMALTNIFAVLTYLVSFTFLKTEKGHDLLVTEDNHDYRKEREKDTKLGR